jgi:hypothetical protein
MKHLFTLLIFFCLAVPGKSQWWFDAGAKGSFGPTLMYDQNVFDSGSYKHKLTTGYSYGARLGFNHGHHVGFSLEYNLATLKQDFNYQSQVYNKFNVRHNDIVGVFRYSGDGAFVEIGAELANIKKVELDNVDAPGIVEVTDNFEKNYLSGVLGFGSYLAGNDLLSVNLGIRLHWAFDDMVSATGKANDYPIIVYPLPDRSQKTLATAAQLQLEINYAFGRFAKTACSERWKLILFN